MLASEGLRSTGAGVAYLELTFGAKLISASSWGRRGSFSFFAVSTPPLVVAISRMTESHKEQNSNRISRHGIRRVHHSADYKQQTDQKFSV